MVIWDSGPWKQELVRTVDRCEREYQQLSRQRALPDWEQRVHHQRAEKAVFLSAFIIRKLMDSLRLSVEVEDGVIEVLRYPLRNMGDAPHSTNWDRIHEFYDLDSPRRNDVPVRHLINWIIHSFVFLLEVRSDLAGGQVFEAFYVNSDRTRKSDLLRIHWAEYRGLIDEVAADHIVEMITFRNVRGDEVQLRSRSHLSLAEREDFEHRHAIFIREAIAEVAQRHPD